MARRFLLISVLVVLVALGTGALVVTGRSTLQSSRDAVDARWAGLRTPLGNRYQALAKLPSALVSAGVPSDRDYVHRLAVAGAEWDRAATRADDPGREVVAADELEGLAARARADTAASPRLSTDPGVTQALAGFDSALVPPADVGAYNDAVRTYQHDRTSLARRPAALVLGFDARPLLVVG